jgi:multidrug transporter EmrE-like cation transporter
MSDIETELVPTKENQRMLIGAILLSVTLAAIAQITLKHGMDQVLASSGAVKLSSPESLKTIVSTASVWIGLVIFATSAVVWLAVLGQPGVRLSFAYPFASLTYVLILLYERFVQHQTISVMRWGGVALILAGIVLVSQTTT